MTFREEIVQLYVATFNRAPDDSGLNYWEFDSGLTIEGIAQSFFDQSETQLKYPDTLSNEVFINAIYMNLFNRTSDDEGLAYWVNELETGSISRSNMILAVTNGAQDTEINLDATILANKAEVGMAHADAGLDGVNFSVSQITANPNTVQNALQDINNEAILIPADDVFTLKKVVDTTISVTTSEETTAMWGGPNGEQITMDQFYEMIRVVTGQDIFELTDSAINIDAETALTNVAIVSQDNDWDENPDGDVVLEFTTATGEQFTSELALAQTHYAFLDSLIYYTDENGNKISRFSTATTEVTNEEISFSYAPIVLTENVNNGGTYEMGYTSDQNDLIVVGQTELLHGAYIDGGAGINTLEVDMKGVYAQPLQLLNIQNVLVQNLPNVYTDFYDLSDDSHRDGYNIPDYLDLTTAQANQATAQTLATAANLAQVNAANALVTAQNALDASLELTNGQEEGENTPPGAETLATLRANVENAAAALDAASANLAQANATLGQANAIVLQSQNLVNSDSILDLSRAIDLQNLVVTEGRMTGNDQAVGDLTIVGVRGNATTTLEGSFVADNVYIFYSQGLQDGVNLTLNLGDAGNTTFSIFHNSNTMNLHSIGGGNELTGVNFGDATIMNMNITGDAELVIGDSIASNFVQGHVAEINASGNTASVDINMDGFTDDLIFTGTAEGDDEFSVSGDYDGGNQKLVIINGGNGNNEFDVINGMSVELTAGDGNNIINVEGAQNYASVSLGDGHNAVYANNVSGEQGVFITIGDGSSMIEATDSTFVNIVTGNGGNTIDVSDTPVSNVTTGSGNDTIIAAGENLAVTINAGDGDNDVQACAANINVTTGEGNDTITLSHGGNIAMVTVDAGAGHNVVKLADSDDMSDGFNSALLAEAGSVIKATGGTIDLVVNDAANLAFAQLENISSVMLNNEHVDAVDLVITADQFMAIGAENFSVRNAGFGEDATLTIVVTESMNFDELGIDANTFDCNNINLNIVLACNDHNDELTFTLTAEQLDQYIAEGGIDAQDNDSNKVVITDAGYNFDPFADSAVDGITGGGTLASGVDVETVYVQGGYERPAEDDYSTEILIDSNVTPLVVDVMSPFADTLKIVGDQDITFTGKINLGDNFTVDFSELNGVAHNMTISQFEDITEANDSADWGMVLGNGTDANPARVNIEITNHEQVGKQGITDGGFKSEDVQTYVVTALLNKNGSELPQSVDSDATVYVCDQTQDLEVLGLQNNRNATITFEQVNWGTEILLEGDGYENSSDQEKNLGNPDLSEVGAVVVDFFEPGANAVVNINNQGTHLGMNEDAEDGYDANGERVLDVAGIEITNADRLEINVTDGDAVIHNVVADDVVRLLVSGDEDVTLEFAPMEDLLTLDATAVAAIFTLDLMNESYYDLSGVELSGIDSIIMNEETMLTLSADQTVVLGSVIVDGSTGADNWLNVNGLSDQVLDLSTVDVDMIGVVTTADVDGTIVLDDATNLGGAHALVILAETSDTALQMTEAQYYTFCHQGSEEGEASISCLKGNPDGVSYDATLILTEISNDRMLDLSNSYVGNAGNGLDVIIHLSDFVATEDFIVNVGSNVESLTLQLDGGDVDLTEMVTQGSFDLDNMAVHFTADATLTATADQIAAILADDENGFSADAGVNVTINVVDLDTQVLDLDAIEDLGINIGTITITDSNTDIVIDPATTFGGADEIITPTADVNDPVDGIEDTTVTMTIAQFLSSNGVITGDSPISLTGLVNNVDTDGDYVADEAQYDLSGVANAYRLYLGEPTVTLTDTADLGDFDIMLDNGQMIQFSAVAQADGTTVTEMNPGDTTAIAWLFGVAATQIDTTNYDGNINTLFINEDLVDGVNEEELWNYLAGSITVEKTNINAIPNVLVGFDRVNTFEAMASIDGVTYDDQNEFQSVENLRINLEGNTNIHDVTVGDTNNADNDAIFSVLTINSYEDRSTLTNDTGFNFQPNKVGDITLTAGSIDSLTNIVINTYADADNVFDTAAPAGTDRTAAIAGNLSTTDDGFYDFENVNGLEAERDGLAIEVGTIHIASGDDTVTSGTITLNGAEDITIAGIDMSDPEITLVEVVNNNTGTVTIAGAEYTGNLYFVDGYTAEAGDLIGSAPADDTLIVVGGDNDLTEATIDIENVIFTGDGTLTLTAAQVMSIGIVDADADGVADNWENNGHSIKLHIIELGNGFNMDLNALQNAGIDIGDISTKANVDVTLNNGTTLGGADNVIVMMDNNNDRTFTLKAEQYEQIAGNITELDTDPTTVNHASVIVTDLDGIALDTDGDTVVDTVHIDLSTVLTTGSNRLELAEAGTAADLTIDLTSNLGDFTVVLDSQGVALNDLAGQTVRFSTQDQASRAIDVINDDGAVDNGTNVVWLFNSVIGQVDTSNYDGLNDATGTDSLGRVWMLESLVDGQNVEELYTHLDESIIIRVVNEDDLDTLLASTNGFDRHIEIESFTTLTSLTFSDVDNAGEPFDFVENLTVDLGGDVVMTDITVSNVLAEPIANDDEFDTLTINSFLADDGSGVADYLLPEDYDNTVHVAPSNANQIGDLASGSNDFDLGRVVINTGTFSNGGNALVAHEIFFSDDGDGLDSTANPTVAELVVTGDSNVTVKSLDTSDADITGLVQDLTTYSGTLLVTGGSPAVDGGGAVGNTETLEIKTDGGGSTSYFGYTYDAVTDTYSLHDNGAGVPYAGVSGLISSDPLDHPASITVRGTGTVNLGVITGIDSENFLVDVKKDAAFVTLTMGEADANGVVDPVLSATGTWTFLKVDELTITEDVVFNTGGQLTITGSDIIIEGAVDFTPLEGNFNFTGSTIFVPAGNTLTIDAAQLVDLVDMQGEGTLVITGDAADLDTPYLLSSGLILVGNIDLSDLVVDSDSDGDTDSDDALTVVLTSTGSVDDAGINAGFNVIGTDASDDITGSWEDDTFMMGAGDDVIYGDDGDDTFHVDAGTDTITDLIGEAGTEQDVLIVDAGATADADIYMQSDFIATAETMNDGVANISANTAVHPQHDTIIDVSLAGGANGFVLTGSIENNTKKGDHSRDELIGSDNDDVINGGNTNQISAKTRDTLTGNGGADVFEFNISLGDNTTFTQETTQIAIDREEVQITGGATADGTLIVAYTSNGGALSVSVDVLNGDSANDVAAKIAAELQANGAFVGSAIVDSASPDTVILTAETGKDIEWDGGHSSAGGTGVTVTLSEGVDQAQIVELTSENDPTDGDSYTVAVELNAAGDETGNAIASGDTADTIITDIASAYGTPGTVDAVDALVGDNMISFEDQDADNGGFTLSMDTTAAFGGSGASNIGATDYKTADVITDFVSSDDSINFVDLAAGSGTNFLAEAAVADYTAALSNAQAAFTANTGTLMYYVTSAADLDGTAGTGLVNGQEGAAVLFFDANLDGNVDGVVLLTGVDENDITALDIIA